MPIETHRVDLWDSGAAQLDRKAAAFTVTCCKVNFFGSRLAGIVKTLIDLSIITHK